ncbi:hypothetical protein RI367_002768 [Sorochytrium milnesiophthora]
MAFIPSSLHQNTAGTYLPVLSVLGLLDIVVQFAIFSILMYTISRAALQYMRNPGWFWRVSLVGLACLAPISLFEATYVLDNYKDMAIIPFAYGAGVTSDILLRIACACIAVCRLQRLRALGHQSRRLSTALFYAVSTIMVTVMATNLWPTLAARLAFNSSTASLEDMWDAYVRARNADIWAFLAIHTANILMDVAFVVAAARLYPQVGSIGHHGHKGSDAHWRCTLPYLPSLLAATLSIVLELTGPCHSLDHPLSFVAVALLRLVPTAQAYTFYNVTVSQTRCIMQHAISSAHNSMEANDLEVHSTSRGCAQPSIQILTSSTKQSVSKPARRRDY